MQKLVHEKKCDALWLVSQRGGRGFTLASYLHATKKQFGDSFTSLNKNF